MAYIGAKRALLGGKKIRWLLRDDFSGILAAGAVHGTKATPGLGTRDVDDTDSKLTIGSGWLNLEPNTTPAHGDPGYWLDAMTRVAGRIIVSHLNMSDVKRTTVGFDVNTSAQASYGFYYQLSNVVYYRDAGGGPSGGTYAINTDYYHVVIVRTAGCYYFRKTNSGNWQLKWDTLTGSDATIYPAITNNDATFTSNFVRVPEQLWLPTPLAYDTFTRSNGAIGSTEVTGPDGQASPVRAWTGATWTIATNKAVNTPTLGATLDSGTLTIGAWYKIVASESNHFFTGSAADDCFRAAAETALDGSNTVKQITLATMFATFDGGITGTLSSEAVTLSTGVQAEGLITNLDSASSPANFLIAWHDGANAHLDKCVGGVYTSLVNVASANSAGDILRLHSYRDGADLKIDLYHKFVKMGTEQTVSDAGIIDNTLCGIMSTNPSNSLDTFQLFAKGDEGQYSVLNKFTR